MIVVREVFIAKPGMASKLAAMFKAEMAEMRGARVMTDLTGAFNTVIMEAEYENMAAFEKEWQEYMNQPKSAPDPAKPKHTDMYIEGKREIFRVW